MAARWYNALTASLVSEITASQTQVVVRYDAGTTLPRNSDISSTDFMLLTVNPDLTDDVPLEVWQVTAQSGSGRTRTLTVVRGYEGTVARGWSAGSKVVNGLTAGSASDFVSSSLGFFDLSDTPSAPQAGRVLQSTDTGLVLSRFTDLESLPPPPIGTGTAFFVLAADRSDTLGWVPVSISVRPLVTELISEQVPPLLQEAFSDEFAGEIAVAITNYLEANEVGEDTGLPAAPADTSRGSGFYGLFVFQRILYDDDGRPVLDDDGFPILGDTELAWAALPRIPRVPDAPDDAGSYQLVVEDGGFTEWVEPEPVSVGSAPQPDIWPRTFTPPPPLHAEATGTLSQHKLSEFAFLRTMPRSETLYNEYDGMWSRMGTYKAAVPPADTEVTPTGEIEPDYATGSNTKTWFKVTNLGFPDEPLTWKLAGEWDLTSLSYDSTNYNPRISGTGNQQTWSYAWNDYPLELLLEPSFDNSTRSFVWWMQNSVIEVGKPLTWDLRDDEQRVLDGERVRVDFPPYDFLQGDLASPSEEDNRPGFIVFPLSDRHWLFVANRITRFTDSDTLSLFVATNLPDFYLKNIEFRGLKPQGNTRLAAPTNWFRGNPAIGDRADTTRPYRIDTYYGGSSSSPRDLSVLWDVIEDPLRNAAYIYAPDGTNGNSLVDCQPIPLKQVIVNPSGQSEWMQNGPAFAPNFLPVSLLDKSSLTISDFATSRDPFGYNSVTQYSFGGQRGMRKGTLLEPDIDGYEPVIVSHISRAEDTLHPGGNLSRWFILPAADIGGWTITEQPTTDVTIYRIQPHQSGLPNRLISFPPTSDRRLERRFPLPVPYMWVVGITRSEVAADGQIYTAEYLLVSFPGITMRETLYLDHSNDFEADGPSFRSGSREGLSASFHEAGISFRVEEYGINDSSISGYYLGLRVYDMQVPADGLQDIYRLSVFKIHAGSS